MTLTNRRLPERSQIQKAMYCTVTSTGSVQNRYVRRDRERADSWLPGSEEGREWEGRLMGTGFLLGVMNTCVGTSATTNQNMFVCLFV